MQKLRRTELREFHQTLSSTSGISSILQQMIQSMHSVNSVKNSVNICAAKRSVIPSHHVYVLALVATVEESKLHLKPIHPTRKPPLRLLLTSMHVFFFQLWLKYGSGQKSGSFKSLLHLKDRTSQRCQAVIGSIRVSPLGD